MRSKLGGHFAGHGMSYPAGYNEDEVRVMNISDRRRGCRLTTDTKKKKDFDDYCKEQSGDVITYNINDMKKD